MEYNRYMILNTKVQFHIALKSQYLYKIYFALWFLA